MYIYIHIHAKQICTTQQNEFNRSTKSAACTGPSLRILQNHDKAVIPHEERVEVVVFYQSSLVFLRTKPDLYPRCQESWWSGEQTL